MSATIKISECLLSRIEQVKEKNQGRLYGLTQNNATLILGYSFKNSIENNLPIGFKELGSIEWIESTSNEIDHNGRDIVHLEYNLKSSELSAKIKSKSNEWENVAYDSFKELELWKEWICLRTKFTLKYIVDSSESLREQLVGTRKKLCETNKPVFKIDGTEIMLKKDKVMIGIGKNAKVNAALQQTKKDQTNSNAKSDPTKFEVLNFILAPSEEESVDDISAIFANTALNESNNTIEVDFEALALVKSSMGANQLYDNVLKSIDRNISVVETSSTDPARSLHTFVFHPRGIGHFISFAYPTSSASDDKEQIAQRKENHTNLNLTRPCLRRDDVYSFDAETSQTHLFNTHIGLKSLVKNGKQYIVKGDYAYHHYMQDNFNDNGWGCAYRSFQTLFSWYRLQGFTNKPVPTHAQIQQCLIDLNDKPKEFLNSRQWIGSMEVSMCLQQFLNVDSRILHVRSGGEMAQHGPTFAQHFTTYGTPVMIGGGVLAHTILGVDFNSETNELKFLVLDPHYTGEENLDIIQKKGWCAWKPITFWDKKSYYNCCMPLFPNDTDY